MAATVTRMSKSSASTTAAPTRLPRAQAGFTCYRGGGWRGGGGSNPGGAPFDPRVAEEFL